MAVLQTYNPYPLFYLDKVSFEYRFSLLPPHKGADIWIEMTDSHFHPRHPNISMIRRPHPR
jgi:hypothetical protein